MVTGVDDLREISFDRYLWLIFITKGVLLLIPVDFIRHSLLSKMFYQQLYGYLVSCIFSRNRVTVTCHSVITDLGH